MSEWPLLCQTAGPLSVWNRKTCGQISFSCFIIRFSVACRFLFCENYMSVFFTCGINEYSLYGSLLQWRSVLSQECERACSGVEQGIAL